MQSTADLVWEGAILASDYKKNDKVIQVVTDKGEKREIKIANETDLPHLRNPAILIGQNDLTALSYLHEPDVLYNLEIRLVKHLFLWGHNQAIQGKTLRKFLRKSKIFAQIYEKI